MYFNCQRRSCRVFQFFLPFQNKFHYFLVRFTAKSDPFFLTNTLQIWNSCHKLHCQWFDITIIMYFNLNKIRRIGPTCFLNVSYRFLSSRTHWSQVHRRRRLYNRFYMYIIKLSVIIIIFYFYCVLNVFQSLSYSSGKSAWRVTVLSKKF